MSIRNMRSWQRMYMSDQMRKAVLETLYSCDMKLSLTPFLCRGEMSTYRDGSGFLRIKWIKGEE